MGEWLQGRVKSVALSILGSMLLLGWWSLRGGGVGDDATEVLSSLPTVACAGGAARLTIDFTTSHAADVSATFEWWDEDAEDSNGVSGNESVEAGTHFWAVDVGGECSYGIVEAQVHDPPVGAELSWVVKLDGLVLDEDTMRLDEPLRRGYGFFLQTGWEQPVDEVLEYMRENA